MIFCLQTHRWPLRFALLVWVINVLFWAAMMLLIFLPRPIHSPVSFVLQRISNSTFILSAATVGAIVAWRRPRNAIGWLLCAAAFSWAVAIFVTEYTLYAMVEAPGVLPGGELALLINHAFQPVTAVAMVYVLLVFPNGRFLSPPWALLGATAIVGEVIAGAANILTLGPVRNAVFTLARIPFGMTTLPAPLIRVAGNDLYLVGALLAAVSLVVRFRRSRSLERAQLKWLAFGSVWAVVVLLLVVVPWTATLAFHPNAQNLVIAQEVLPALGIFALSLIPLAIGIALLRYRLYDIDIIINRTLVYATVTALLAGLFAALSVLAQRLTLAVTGQESEIAVVLAALVVTALFQPVRWRVQTLVDRRFYRTKYDASRTLECFASQLRDEVELDRLTNSLVAAVQETMQPAHTSLWLRPRLGTPAANALEPN